jgi:hypothetical protein
VTAPPQAVPDVRSAISGEAWSIDELVAEVRAGPPPLAPFDDRLVAFCTALSGELLTGRAARGLPAVVALGYWLRAASVERARRAFAALEDEHTILVPRGVVLHVTPANVDTIAAYSWIPALLTGNASIVRLSSRETDVSRHLVAAVARVLADPAHVEVRRRNRLVHAGHDDRISGGLSALADVRVVWGGDATIAHFRTFPLPPRGRDVTFPNRHSLAILDAEAVAAATGPELADLADRFFNDAYWFDQGACSSPRLVVWVTRGVERAAGPRRRFKAAVTEAIRRRGYVADPAIAIQKVVLGYRRAAEADGVRYERDTNEATWVELPDPALYDRASCGGGIFFELVTHDLEADLEGLVGPEDQTAACFGLEPGRVRQLARRLNGRGVDRWVALGRALEFDLRWDGYDLLQEFTRRVVVDLAPRGPGGSRRAASAPDRGAADGGRR